MHHQQYVQNSCNPVYPRNMVCFRYVSVNTLHKGDDDYNIMAINERYALIIFK
jgi:hypothetical protein